MSEPKIRAITFTTVFSAAYMRVPASRYDVDGPEWRDWTVAQDEEDGAVWMRHKKQPVAVRVPEQLCIIEYDLEEKKGKGKKGA